MNMMHVCQGLFAYNVILQHKWEIRYFHAFHTLETLLPFLTPVQNAVHSNLIDEVDSF